MWGRKTENRRRLSPQEIKTQRRHKLGSVLKALVPWLLVLAVLGGLGALVAAGWESGLQVEFFMVESVKVEGASRLSQGQVKELLVYKQDKPYLFGLDMQASREALEALPWVKEAQVDRVIPDKVHVSIQEREPAGMAFVGKLMLVDADGIPFKEVEGDGMDRALVTGLGENPEDLTDRDYERIRDALGLMEAYKKQGLERFERLSEVELDPHLGYVLVTETRGTRIILGEGRLEARLVRLGEVLAELEQRKLRATSIRLDAERSLKRVPIELAGRVP